MKKNLPRVSVLELELCKDCDTSILGVTQHCD
jgi:hypothetical protein